jgi:hypothetical protein
MRGREKNHFQTIEIEPNPILEKDSGLNAGVAISERIAMRCIYG